LKVKVPVSASDNCKRIVEACLRFDPQSRPDASDLVSILRKLRNGEELEDDSLGPKTTTTESTDGYGSSVSESDAKHKKKLSQRKLSRSNFTSSGRDYRENILFRKEPFLEGASGNNTNKEFSVSQPTRPEFSVSQPFGADRRVPSRSTDKQSARPEFSVSQPFGADRRVPSRSTDKQSARPEFSVSQPFGVHRRVPSGSTDKQFQVVVSSESSAPVGQKRNPKNNLLDSKHNSPGPHDSDEETQGPYSRVSRGPHSNDILTKAMENRDGNAQDVKLKSSINLNAVLKGATDASPENNPRIIIDGPGRTRRIAEEVRVLHGKKLNPRDVAGVLEKSSRNTYLLSRLCYIQLNHHPHFVSLIAT